MNIKLINKFGLAAFKKNTLEGLLIEETQKDSESNDCQEFGLTKDERAIALGLAIKHARAQEPLIYRIENLKYESPTHKQVHQGV